MAENIHAIEIENLTVSYDGFLLDHVSFCVPKGSIMGVIGQNGAGKTIYHDENRRYSAFISSTPLTENGQVRCKYLEMLLLAFVMIAWGEVCDRLAGAVNGISGNTLGIRMVFFFAQIFFRALETPFLVRYGTKVGKQVKLLMLAAIAFLGIVYLLFGPLPDPDSVFETIGSFFLRENNRSDRLRLCKAALSCAVVLLYYFSYRISCRLYQKGAENYDV